MPPVNPSETMSTLSGIRSAASTAAKAAAREFTHFDPSLGLGFPAILTTGGDDRAIVQEKTGTNKYLTVPQPMDVLFRGSCTCSPPTPAAYSASGAAMQALKESQTTHSSLMESIRQRLAAVFELPEGTGVFLCPSGSDAEYLPLAFAKQVNPAKPIVNVVTCAKEVGTGTAPASQGQYFSPLTPLRADKVDPSHFLNGFGEVKLKQINARDPMGEPVVAGADIQKIVDETRSTGSFPIIHSVIGSKTGICEAVPDLQPNDGMLVVDACQGRFHPSIISKLVSHNQALVLFTGSKFYEGPPFSGAVFVPSYWMKMIQETEPFVPNGLGDFFSRHELPSQLAGWGQQLPPHENKGLALRWIAALEELEPTARISADDRTSAENMWRAHVETQVNKFTDVFEILRDTDTASIVSIKIRPSVEDAFLQPADLKLIYTWMSKDMSDKCTKPAAKSKCLIGQPVQTGPDFGVLRIALGANSLRRLLTEPEATLAEDTSIVEKLAVLASEFKQLRDQE